MPKLAWTIGAILTGVVILALLGLSSCVKQQELARAQAALAQAQAQLALAQSTTGSLQAKVGQIESQVQQLQREKAAVEKSRSNLEGEMRAALESKDVTISELQGKLTVNILDRVLFDSGEAVVKPEGEAVLKKVADFLTQHPQLKIHVIGHTDNIPIRATARSRFPSNWELSTTRATAAVRFLTEKAGVDPHRLGAVGYGEFRPIADNSTPEGRSKNRRIAITILSEELVGVDMPPPLSSTNLPALPAGVPISTNAPALPEPPDPPSDGD